MARAKLREGRGGAANHQKRCISAHSKSAPAVEAL
jgi:hypothetical protein